VTQRATAKKQPRPTAKAVKTPGPKQKLPAIPIHHQISSVLRQRIAAGAYDTSRPFPPELDLMEEFGCSRHTIRASIQSLVADGLLKRRRGAGTTIIQREPAAATWAIASLEDLIKDYYEVELVSATIVPAKEHPAQAELFGVRKSANLFRVVLILSSTNGPFSLSTIFTTVENGMTVPRDRISSNIFLFLLEEYGGLKAVRAQQSALAALPTKEAQDALNFEKDEAMLVLRRTFYDRLDKPIEYVEMLCRSSRYAQMVEFVRTENLEP